MRKFIYDLVLERCPRTDCKIVNYFEHMTRPRLLAPVRKSRDLTLLITFRRPILEIHSQGKYLNLLKSINIPSDIWVPDDGAVLKVGADK